MKEPAVQFRLIPRPCSTANTYPIFIGRASWYIGRVIATRASDILYSIFIPDVVAKCRRILMFACSCVPTVKWFGYCFSI